MENGPQDVLAIPAFSAVVAWCACAVAQNQSPDISRYWHTSWTARDGFSSSASFAMAQTPDGYLRLGGEFGLYRFDGVRAVPWQPPAGLQIPHSPYALLAIAGRHAMDCHIFEDHEGTVWAGRDSMNQG